MYIYIYVRTYECMYCKAELGVTPSIAMHVPCRQLSVPLTTYLGQGFPRTPVPVSIFSPFFSISSAPEICQGGSFISNYKGSHGHHLENPMENPGCKMHLASFHTFEISIKTPCMPDLT